MNAIRITLSGLLAASLFIQVAAQAPAPAPSSTTAAASAEPTPVGKWHTISDTDGKPRGVVEIVEKNGVLEGRITGTLRPNESLDSVCDVCPGDRKGKKMLGMLILSGLKKDGQGADAVWTGGEILDPDNGKLYRVKLELENGGRTLKVRGYIGVSLLGRTQRWQRAP
jgi:uncharacterized protein (DUF2147 family)